MSAAADRVVTQLKARRVRDGEWRCKCPAHGGKSQTSLSIKAENDRVLIFCHAGCELKDILNALRMTTAELFDSIGVKPDPEARRQARIQRGLTIWAERRLTFVCRSLRELEEIISTYVRSLTEDTMTGEAWELLAQLYRLRSDLDCEFHILNRGDLQEIYDEIFRRLR